MGGGTPGGWEMGCGEGDKVTWVPLRGGKCGVGGDMGCPGYPWDWEIRCRAVLGSPLGWGTPMGGWKWGSGGVWDALGRGLPLGGRNWMLEGLG